jgi:hypothetical protein
MKLTDGFISENTWMSSSSSCAGANPSNCTGNPCTVSTEASFYRNLNVNLVLHLL